MQNSTINYKSITFNCFSSMIVLLVLLFLKFEESYSHLKNIGEEDPSALDDLQLVLVVAGGERTSLVEHPYNVKFFNGGNMCGGVIISAKHVLTAAHCFDVNKDLTEMKVISNSETNFGVHSMVHDVWHFEIHDKYGVGTVYANDIAILLIHDQFKFGKKVQKALLVEHGDWMTEEEKMFTVTGWGETENLGQSNYQILRKAHLRYISHGNCSKMSQLVLTPDMFCLFGDGKRDSARGDSGGGVLWKNLIVGIISHGRNINVPGAYANVYYLLPWIKNMKEMLSKRFCDFHHGSLTGHHNKLYFHHHKHPNVSPVAFSAVRLQGRRSAKHYLHHDMFKAYARFAKIKKQTN